MFSLTWESSHILQFVEMMIFAVKINHMNREHGNIPMFLSSVIFPLLMISLGFGQSNIPQLKY